MDDTQGIFIFLGISWELKPTFALSKEKILKRYFIDMSSSFVGTLSSFCYGKLTELIMYTVNVKGEVLAQCNNTLNFEILLKVRVLIPTIY